MVCLGVLNRPTTRHFYFAATKPGSSEGGRQAKRRFLNPDRRHAVIAGLFEFEAQFSTKLLLPQRSQIPIKFLRESQDLASPLISRNGMMGDQPFRASLSNQLRPPVCG
jgi:hypothetical protein